MFVVMDGSKEIMTGDFKECKEYVDKFGGTILEPTGLLGFMCVAYVR